MSDGSKIEWTDATWPVVTGCTHISEGCDNCYAAKLTGGRLRHRPEYAGLADKGRFNGTVRCLSDRLDWPLHWRKPRKVFVSDMADLFHDSVPDEFIACVFVVMARTPQHTYQVLTKRHGRMRSLLSSPDFRMLCFAAATAKGWDLESAAWPLPNVWLGVSVENQKWADIRIPALCATPAAVRFLSCEPLLGPVDLKLTEEVGGCNCAGGTPESSYIHERHCGLEPGPSWGKLHWVIAGGESGPGARPMVPSWARSLRDQCRIVGVPFFFKQWGSFRWVGHSVYDDETQCWVERGIEPQRVSKKLAGRELDGRTWDEFPHAAEAVPA